MAHDVFVSYANEDKATADALLATLEQHDIRCWIHTRDGSPGRDYAEKLIEAIGAAQVMVLVFSASANNSGHVMREVERAASKGIAILPLRIEDVAPSKSMEFFISGTHWLDALTPPLEQHLEQLARSVAALLDAAPGTEAAARPAGIAQVTLEIGPPRGAGPFGARLTATSHDLTLRNGGDEGVDLQLNADDDGGHCSFSLPNGVTVPPHGATTVTIKVRPRARRWRGSREIRWFSVMASSGDGGQPPAIVSGQFEDMPYGWLPYGLGSVVGMIIAVVVGVTVAFGVGREDQLIVAPSPTQSSANPTAAAKQPTLAPSGMDVETATALLDRAVEAKDLSNQGQIEALEVLLGVGFDFDGADLSGIRLAGVNIAGASFAGAMLTGSDLSGSSAGGVDFTEAELRFANLDGADLTGASLVNARLTFADAESANFTRVNARHASFYGGNLQGANFRDADLSGAIFMMADLRGAQLDGANLEDTLFFATLLDGATFDGATFNNTEITGSSVSDGALTADQANGTCTSLEDMATPGPIMDGVLLEEIPSSRFTGGIEYVDLMAYADYFYLEPISTRGLDSCRARSEDVPGIWYASGAEQLDTDYGMSYDTSLISKAGRRTNWVTRIIDHMSMITDALNGD